MTQHHKILKQLAENPKKGITVRDGYRLGINWPHKRIRELEAMGVKIKRIDESPERGARFRRYILSDPDQNRVKELLSAWDE